MKYPSLLILGVIAFHISFSQKQFNAGKNPEKAIAICNYYLENYGAAIKGLSEAFNKDTTDADVAYMLGSSYVNLEQYQPAVPFYSKAVELNPNNSSWAYELGLLYYNTNDFKQAAIFFNRAAAAGYRKNNDFNENLGYAYIYSGKLQKGEKLLLNIFTKKPANKGVLRDIAEAYYNQKMYDKSLEYCHRLTAMNANDAGALYQAGLCLQKKGQKNKGQVLCEKALDIDPSIAVTLHTGLSMGL